MDFSMIVFTENLMSKKLSGVKNKIKSRAQWQSIIGSINLFKHKIICPKGIPVYR